MDLNYEIQLADEREATLERMVVDLRSCTWDCPGGWAEDGPGHEGGCTLVLDDGQELKLSPEAFKQLAERAFGGLHKVLMKSPEHLSKPLLNHWLIELHEDKSQVILKVSKNYIWGMVGIEQSDISGAMVLRSVTNTLQSLGGGAINAEPLHMDREQRDQRGTINSFHPIQFYRLELEGLKFEAGGETLYPVIDLRFSDFALGKFEVDLGFNDSMNAASALLRKKGRALYNRNYRAGLDTQEIERLIMLVVERMPDQIAEIKSVFDNDASEPLTEEEREEIYENLPRFRDCTEIFGERVVENLRNNPPKNLIGIYKTIIALAGEEKLPSQVKHEAFAAHMLGLVPLGVD